MKNNICIIQFQMVPYFRNICFNTAVKLFNNPDLSYILIILSDGTIIDINSQEQLIKYNFDDKNIVRVINPDILIIYNIVLNQIKKKYNSHDDFASDYEKDTSILYSKITDKVDYPIELVERVIDDIYLNNTILKKKRSSGLIININISISMDYVLYFYYKKSMFHIENISINRCKISNQNSKLIPTKPGVYETIDKYQIMIHDIKNYKSDTLKKKNFYYVRKNNDVFETMKKLETYLWIKNMILREMSGKYKFMESSSEEDSFSSTEIEVDSDEYL